MQLNHLPMARKFLESVIDRHPLVVTPDTLLADVLALMAGNFGTEGSSSGAISGSGSMDQPQISYVLVMERAELKGILTERDAVRLCVTQAEWRSLTVAEVIRQPVTAVLASEVQTAAAVLAALRQYQVSHLPVLNEQGKLLGVLTPETVYRGLQFGVEVSTQPEMREDKRRRYSSLGKSQLERIRYQLEEQLIQVLPEVQSSLPGFPDLYFRLDANGIILDYKARHLFDLYVFPEEFLNKPIQELFPPSVGQQFQLAILQVLQTNELVIIDYWLPMLEGQKSFEARLMPSLNQQIIVMISDNTEHKRTEAALQAAKAELEIRVEERTAALKQANQQLLTEVVERRQIEVALRESQTQLQAILDNCPALIYVVDTQNRYVLINREYETVSGVTSQQVVGRSIYDLWCQEAADIFNTHIQQVLATRAPLQIEEVALQADGIHTYFSVKFPLCDANGVPYAVGGICTDVTDRKRAEEKIRTSLQEKEVLLKEIHHRVKNNLQIISSLLKLQARNVNDPPTLDILQDSQNRIRSMALIHEKLYQSQDLTKIDFSEYIRNLAFDIFRSYGTSLNMVELKLAIENISLSVDTAIPCGLIVNELVSNALKHAFPQGRQGTISINLWLNTDNHYVLTVSDNGIGLPQDLNLQNIQSLGVTLVCTLARQLEGTLELERHNGTTFKVTFPCPIKKKT